MHNGQYWVFKTKLLKTAAHMAFRLLPSRLRILYRAIVILKCCFNNYRNTFPISNFELYLRLQLKGNEYSGVSFLLLTADQEFIELRFLVKCPTVRTSVYVKCPGFVRGGGGDGRPWN